MSDDVPDRFREAEGQLDLFPPCDEPPWWYRPLAYGVVLGVALFMLALPLLAAEVTPPVNPDGKYGVGHMQYHQQYKRMHNQLDTDCCNNGDCRPTTARYNATTRMWEAKVDGEWRAMTPDRHVKDAYGLTEFASVCAGKTGYVFCFIPPNSGF